MSAILKQALKSGHIRNAILCVIDHPDGTGYFWDGEGILEYNGNTYHGSGLLGNIESVTESLEVEILQVTFSVSGVDPTLTEKLDKSIKGYRAQVFDAILSDNYQVIHIEQTLDVELDNQSFAYSADGTAIIKIIGHGGLFFLDNRSSAKWSSEQAKQSFPNETGFDEVHLVENQVDDWGLEIP